MTTIEQVTLITNCFMCQKAIDILIPKGTEQFSIWESCLCDQCDQELEE
jgi:hypothetical protein